MQEVRAIKQGRVGWEGGRKDGGREEAYPPMGGSAKGGRRAGGHAHSGEQGEPCRAASRPHYCPQAGLECPIRVPLPPLMGKLHCNIDTNKMERSGKAAQAATPGASRGRSPSLRRAQRSRPSRLDSRVEGQGGRAADGCQCSRPPL